METCSSLFTISIFLLGATCGGLLVTIQRQARMDRIKAMFAEELHQMSVRSNTEVSAIRESKNVRTTEIADSVGSEEASADMEEYLQAEWMLHHPSPRSDEHHVGG